MESLIKKLMNVHYSPLPHLFTSLILALTMGFALGAWAETVPVKYVAPVYKGTDGNPTNGIACWTTNTCANYSLVTSVVEPSGFAWGEDGKTTWLVVADPGVVITGSPKCFGHVNLILCDGASLRVTDGIRTDSNAMTIYAGCEGTGQLIAEGSQNGAAGIGGGDGGIGNNITINGGRIKAMGNGGGAGIGGGNSGSASNIVINAGVVTAIGSKGSYSGGAGIGGGSYRTGCDITINGGTVVATGAVYAAGIGGGSNNPGMRIVINDGVVQAVGGGSGAGIGGGYGWVGTNVVIRGGKVIATGGDYGAGIGGGQGGVGSQIAISGGEVRATGGNGGAGIGGGSNAVGSDIAISGGLVLATGGNTAAGIGGGYGYDGSGSRITISSGTVTAIGGYLGTAIGGGMRGDGSQITIGGDTKVFVGGPRQIMDGIVSAADLIGCGYGSEETAEEVTVDATAQIFFNLTGCYDENTKTMCEQVAPMPAAFDSFVLMTPERQAESRVLVGGVSTSQPLNLSTFSLTNAVTGATDALEVNGAETTFAGTYCSLTNVNGNLTFAVRPPVLTITQQPNVTNAYSIVATTDGNDDITNYVWCVESKETTGFVALTNALEAATVVGMTAHGDIEGTSIRSINDEVDLMNLVWLPDDNSYGITGIPKGGKLYFTCASDISAKYEEMLGPIHRIGETDEWVWEARLCDVSEGEGMFVYALMLSADEQFSIDNLRWVASSYEPVAQGAKMTALPADVGVVGKKYICRMDYGHEGVFYTGASDVFTCEAAVVAVRPEPIERVTTAVYTNGVPVTASEPGLWVLEKGVSPAKIVYAVSEAGYYFADGSTVITNDMDTSTNPATLPAAPAAPIIPVASVTTNGVTTAYSDINDAWQSAITGTEASPATLKLLADIALTNQLETSSEGVYLKFDLNDHVLSSSIALAGSTTLYNKMILFTSSSGKFELVDSAETKTKKYFTEATDGRWMLSAEPTSRFVEGGVITGSKENSAVWLSQGDIEIRDVSFVGNHTLSSGAALFVACKPVNVYNTRFYGNVADNGGGAIDSTLEARFLMKNCDVRFNVAGGSGGGISMQNKCVLIDTSVSDNVATNKGAGIYFEKKTSCLAAGTMILMADGRETPIEEISEGDLVATFDHEGGTNAASRVYLAYKGPSKARPFTLEFDSPLSNSNSSLQLTIVGIHDLLEESSRKYVRLTEANAATFVGKRFYGRDGAWHTLTSVTFGAERVAFYSIYSARHQNAYANGLLTVCDDIDYIVNIYELDENLKADPDQLAADIEKYGLRDFAFFSDNYGMTFDWYEAGNCRYNNIAMGKGLISWEALEELFGSIEEGHEGNEVLPVRALKMAKAMTLGATPVEPKLSDYDDFGDGVLVLGANAVVTNNSVGAMTNSNIYLATSDSKIALAEAHAGILAGVALASGIGQFTKTNNVSVADVALFTSDDPEYAVRFDANGTFLKLGYAGIQVGDDAWAQITDGLCTVVGTGDMWSHDNPSNSPLWSLKGAITRVVVGDSVTGVGKNDFSYMGALKDVEIGNSVTQVAAKAFYRCTYVTNLVVGAYVTTVGAAAFERCYSLETFRFGSQETALACQDAFKIVARITMDGETPIVDAVPEVTIDGWNRELQGKTNLTDAVWISIDETKPIPYGFHFFKYAFVLPPE